MQVKFISETQAEGMTPEQLVVYCARVSSGKTHDEKLQNPEKLLRYCINHEHWSIFEMADMTVEITTSIPIAMQILRHKFQFQQFSARYQEVQGFEPIEIRREHEKNRQSSAEVFDPQVDFLGKASEAIKIHLDESKMLYNALLDADVAREVARFVLPQAATTTLYMKGSLRNWIHYINVRTKEDTQKEHRLIAEECKRIFSERYPIIASAVWK